MTIEEGNVAQLIFAGWMFRSALAVAASKEECRAIVLITASAMCAAVGAVMLWAGVAQ